VAASNGRPHKYIIIYYTGTLLPYLWWWVEGLVGACFVSETLGVRAVEEERTLLNYAIIYMSLYTLRAVCTDHVWPCLATTHLKASHDSISHGAHDLGHLRWYPATGVRLYAQGTGIVLIRACAAKVLGT
jgi:hypothetical protein